MFAVSVCILSNTAATVSGDRMVPTSVANSAIFRSVVAAVTAVAAVLVGMIVITAIALTLLCLA